MESTLASNVKDWLNKLDHCKAIKMHGSIYTERGTPDILCCFHGRLFMFELKEGRNKPEKIQEVRKRQWRESGATVHTVWSLEEVQRVMKQAGAVWWEKK